MMLITDLVAVGALGAVLLNLAAVGTGPAQRQIGQSQKRQMCVSRDGIWELERRRRSGRHQK